MRNTGEGVLDVPEKKHRHRNQSEPAQAVLRDVLHRHDRLHLQSEEVRRPDDPELRDP